MFGREERLASALERTQQLGVDIFLDCGRRDLVNAVLELLERHSVEAAAVRVAEAGGRSVSLGRSEVEGVIQEALASAGLPPTRHVAAAIRGAFGVRNNAGLEPALMAVPAIDSTGSSRREPVISAVALLPE